MTKKNLEKAIQRQEDIHEIENLMCRYIYLHAIGLDDEVSELFALNTPGVEVGMVWGVYEGAEGVRGRYKTGRLGESGVGSQNSDNMIYLPQTSPYIEVAGDGKTARGMWLMPGLGTNPDDSLVGHRLQAHWSWARYGNDFIKENGKWKIWHCYVYSVFRPRFERSWVDHCLHALPVGTIGQSTVYSDKADRPRTYNWEWNGIAETENVPSLPEPYETWDDSMKYIV